MQIISEIKLLENIVVDYKIEGVCDEKTAAAWVARLISSDTFKVDSAFYKKAYSNSLIGETSCRINREDYARIFDVSKKRTADGIIFYCVFAKTDVIMGIYFDDYSISITVNSQNEAILSDIEAQLDNFTNSMS